MSSAGMFGSSLRRLLMNNKFIVNCTRNKLSTDSKVSSPKIYELRVYTSYPKDFKKTLKLYEDYMHLRLNHSKLFGFWTTEIGSSIFQSVHIWEYDSLSHRLKVRQSMLQDTLWQTEYLPQFTPCMQSQTNALLVPTPESSININFKNDPAAVYELQSTELYDEDSLPVESGGKGGTLVGRFTGVFGSTNMEYKLWRYPDIDTAFSESWSRSKDVTEEGTSLLLYPVKFSPIS